MRVRPRQQGAQLACSMLQLARELGLRRLLLLADELVVVLRRIDQVTTRQLDLPIASRPRRGWLESV